MTKSKTAVYLRVSKFVGQESGIESQERTVREYLDGHGINDAVFYRDKLSGKNTKRPAFEKLQKDIFHGRISSVVVWKLDRLSRNLRDGIVTLTDWLERDVRIVAVSQQLDFSGPAGKLIASVLFALGEMERESLRENTLRGLANARAKGVVLGRRPKLFAKDITPLMEGGATLADAARQLGCSRQAIYNCLQRENIAIPKGA